MKLHKLTPEKRDLILTIFEYFGKVEPDSLMFHVHRQQIDYILYAGTYTTKDRRILNFFREQYIKHKRTHAISRTNQSTY